MFVLANAAAPRVSGLPLAGVVRRLAADRSLWRDQVQHHPHRWWTRIVATDALDVWLITWPTDGQTELHDHGGSWAAFTVLSGRLTEVSASISEGSVHRRSLHPGPIAMVPPGGIHDVINERKRPAVSLHAYSPPLRRMTYFSEDEGVLRATRTAEAAQSAGWLDP